MSNLHVNVPDVLITPRVLNALANLLRVIGDEAAAQAAARTGPQVHEAPATRSGLSPPGVAVTPATPLQTTAPYPRESTVDLRHAAAERTPPVAPIRRLARRRTGSNSSHGSQRSVAVSEPSDTETGRFTPATLTTVEASPVSPATATAFHSLGAAAAEAASQRVPGPGPQRSSRQEVFGRRVYVKAGHNPGECHACSRPHLPEVPWCEYHERNEVAAGPGGAF